MKTKDTSKEALNEICNECNQGECDKKYGACPNFKKVWNDLEELEKYKKIEEELGISILDFYKILKVRHIWAEVGLDLTDRFNEFVLFDIKEFDVELNRILLKENKYNLRSIPFNMYKICFWLSRDKSE